MESSDGRKRLTGMARSVDALFSATRRADAVAWEEVEEPPGPDPAAADPDALRAAVSDFLASPPLEREGKARTLRLEAASLREARAYDVVADAVERLTRESGDPPDEACLAMARVLLHDEVGARIAARLGAARNEERREELAATCLRLGGPMLEALVEALTGAQDRFARRTFVDTIVAFGPAAMPVVERMAEDDRWFVVRNAAAILGEIGGERAAELVTATLAHADGRARREALRALAKIGGADAGPIASGMLEDSDPDVRVAAAMAAGELKARRALNPLLTLAEEESDPTLLVAALRALGQLGDESAVGILEKRATGSFFRRPPTEVRIAAYRALHKIRNPHTRTLLVEALDDRDREVKGAVQRLLRAP